MRFILRPLLYLFFSKLMKMKIKDGDVAATTVKAVSAIDFPSQLRYIQQLRDSHVQVLMVYSGSDPFIEQSISDHLVEAFGSIKRLICSSVVPEDSTTDEYIEAVRSGERKVAVCFAKEGHQLQKTRAKFLADAIVAMLEMNQNPATMH
uniref:Uncharacterized protein n=1 Tax=Parascaris univalens TaxID=6257 RepID=A0A915C314_PARUN